MKRISANPMAPSSARTRVCGRSLLSAEGRKLHVRGVTYGTFAPSSGGSPFPGPERARADLRAMAQIGVNALRTYVTPPLWFLDLCHEEGIRVMAGVAWEQHVAFLEDRTRAREIVRSVGDQVAGCAAHPAILCYALGNEIPAPIVRWHGKRPLERFLETLYQEGKHHDPEGLFTYVSYPSTEYLELPFLDLAAFNVFLEEEDAYAAYLARLQNVAGDRPLLITELGLDSRRNGELAQAQALEWQLRHAFATGAAGAFVFSWTDEWHRGGHDVTDWDFGLVDRGRRPKPALGAVRDAFSRAPFDQAARWPRISVVVCTHQGAATLPECLEHVGCLAYPDYETIVVCDGSRDGSAEVARAHGAIVIETEHRGLSHARNRGIDAATGELIAFLDDDAYPDADWLHYLAAAFADGTHAGAGGPNLPPADDGLVADCVAVAPGGPMHVLISDREAEHLPGCNMAFRRSALLDIGGFDERFRTAGDDVDVCWRLQKAGHTLAFTAGAVVMHRRRGSVRRYLRQQLGYGQAEALLERKWPTRYNRAGASRWSGRIYEGPRAGGPGARRRPLVRYGTWGNGLFQSIYEPPPSTVASLLGMPETLLLLALLGAVSALGALWRPLLLGAVPFAAVLGWILGSALSSGWRAHGATPHRTRVDILSRRLLTGLLYILQPAARLTGRLRGGLSPWRRRLRPGAGWPRPRTVELWSETWSEPAARVEALQDALALRGGLVRSGGPFDRWDLELRTGPVGGVKLRIVVEEHGAGRQLMRVRIWPRASAGGLVTAIAACLLATFAWTHGRSDVATAIVVGLAALVALALEGAGTATGLASAEARRLGDPAQVGVGVGVGVAAGLSYEPGPAPRPAVSRRAPAPVGVAPSPAPHAAGEPALARMVAAAHQPQPEIARLGEEVRL